MKRLLTAMIAAITLGLSAPAAMAASAPQTAAEERAGRQWLSDLMEWSSGYNTVMENRTRTLEWLSTSATQLIAKLDAGDKGAARTFAVAVAAEGRTRLSAEMTAYQALPTTPPTFPLTHLIAPSQREILTVFTRMPDRFGAMMISSDLAGRNFIDHLELAASGRLEDLRVLINAYYDLAVARSEILITMNDNMKGGSGPTGANIDRLRDLMNESERAMIVWVNYNRATDLGQPFDYAAAARAIRAHAEIMHRDAGETARRSNSEIVTLRATPSYSSTPLGQIMLGAHASLVRSADAEHRIADTLSDVARAIESTPTDPEGAAQRLAVLSETYNTLIGQRVEEDMARRRLIAQNPG